MLVILLLLGAVLPLAITPGLLFHYDVSPKTITLCLAAAIALLRVRAVPEELGALWSRRGGRALVLITALQILWISIVSALSTRPWFSLFGSGWRQFGVTTIVPMLLLAVLVAAHFCKRPENITTFLRVAVCAGIVASVYGIAQYFDIDPFQSAAIYHAQAGDSVIVRPPGTLGHADYFAWWLAIEFFCGLAVAKSEVSGWRTAGIACAAAAAAATLLSGTRAAGLAIVAGVAVLWVFGKFRVGRKHLWAAGVLLVLAGGFYFSPAGARLRARAVWAGDEPAGGARLWLWRDSLRMSAARPVFGFGPETFQAAFGLWESEDLARQYPDFHHESPHNLALDALTSEGIPGLLLLCAWGWLGWSAAAGALRVRLRFAAPLAAALAASLATSMFDAASLGPLLLTLLVLAVLVALEPPRPSGRLSLTPWIFAGTGCALAAACVAFAVTLSMTDFRLVRFQQTPVPETYEAMRRVRMSGAAEDIFCSRTLLNRCEGVTGLVPRIECWRVAEQVAARATTTADDTANAWYNLALFTAAQNDVRGTRMALARASQAAPVWFKPHWALANLLSRTGDPGTAEKEAERAAWLNANHDREVSETLHKLRRSR
jgi:O-antigen ligase